MSTPAPDLESPPGFIGRARERTYLEELHASRRAELFVLYGRRRVGKTELLQQFCQAHRSVYFLAAQVRDRDNLRSFRNALAESLGDPLAASVEFPPVLVRELGAHVHDAPA